MSFGQDAAGVMVNPERGERTWITTSSEKESERNITFHKLNSDDETRGNIPGEFSELSVPKTYFDRQSHTHHTAETPIGSKIQSIMEM